MTHRSRGAIGRWPCLVQYNRGALEPCADESCASDSTMHGARMRVPSV
jgi:hypothetical protein